MDSRGQGTLSVFRRHPSLLLQVPRGKAGVMISHARIEVKDAQRVFAANRANSLEEIVGRHEASACYNYKSTYLYSMTRVAAPKTVVETGVAAGVSSFSILQALQDNGAGMLYSIDLPNATEKIPAHQEPGFLVPDELRWRWTLKLGDARDLLPPLLSELGTIDMFCHDSLHTYGHMDFEYETVWPHLKEGGLLYSDDVGLSSAFSDFCSRSGLKGTTLSRRELGKTVEFGWALKQAS